LKIAISIHLPAQLLRFPAIPIRPLSDAGFMMVRLRAFIFPIIIQSILIIFLVYDQYLS